LNDTVRRQIFVAMDMGGVGVTESPTLRTGDHDGVPTLPSVAKTPISNENGIASNPLHHFAAVAKVVPDE
jgi:hypothetical protein